MLSMAPGAAIRGASAAAVVLISTGQAQAVAPPERCVDIIGDDQYSGSEL